MEDPILVRLLDDARVASAADERRRQEVAGLLASEEATVAGLLVGLAEAAQAVTVHGVGGRAHSGRVVLVGADVVGFVTAAGTIWVRLAALTSVTPSGGPAALGGEGCATDVHLVDVLALLVDDRPEVALITMGGDVLIGMLEAVGVDVVGLRQPTGPVYVPVGAIAEVRRTVEPH
jgi:hypothetical protein